MAVRDASPSSGQGSKVASYGQKEFAALERWDQRRGPWRITYHLDFGGHSMSCAIRQVVLTLTLATFQRMLHIPPQACPNHSTGASRRCPMYAYQTSTAKISYQCLEKPTKSQIGRIPHPLCLNGSAWRVLNPPGEPQWTLGISHIYQGVV